MVSSSFYGADPLREMRRLQSEMNRVFEANAAARVAEFPPINAYANQDGAVITAELPGVRPGDLNVSVHRDSVTLSSERRSEADEARAYHRRERHHGRFNRTVALPFQIDPDRVEASITAGVLTITLQRAEADKPKRITVQAS
jgi:HSP20 family protein